jgi:uncharacterized membrane protein
MKKLLFTLLTLALILTTFFYYERKAFDQYIAQSTKSGQMKIPINPNAPVISTGQIQINAPLSTVWETLTNINNWPAWQKNITETVVHGNIQQGTAFDWKADGLSFQSTIHTAIPQSSFGWTGTTFGASAIHNWTFEARGNTTIVKVQESLQGVFPKLFRGSFQKNLNAGVVASLQELKAAAEVK